MRRDMSMSMRRRVGVMGMLLLLQHRRWYEDEWMGSALVSYAAVTFNITNRQLSTRLAPFSYTNSTEKPCTEL